MHKILGLILSFVVVSAMAQTSGKYNSPYVDFYRAEDLFLKGQFAAARTVFHDFHSDFTPKTDPLVIQARYYEGLSALSLYQNDGVDLLLAFDKDYPESLYKKEISWKLAQYYYQKKDYLDALTWFDKLSPNDVIADEREEFFFKRGYSHFSENQLREARNNFYEIKASESQYGLPALYYYSHVEYSFGSYQTALDGFHVLAKDVRFGRVAPYYVAQIYYLQGRYKEVMSYGPQILDSIPKTYEKDLQLIIGDAYFKTGKYAESIPYLARYNQRSATTVEMDYQLGYAYFKNKDYEKAIPLFDRATKRGDSLAQKAYYQIGESYFQLEKFTIARSAFEEASKMDYNSDVSEDALYQYAVLSYKLDLNPYNEAVLALEKYLNIYPNSRRKDDVYQYLVNVYATTNNYEKALASLDRLPNKDYRLKSIYQVLAFNAGVEQFQKTNYNDALRFFDLAQKNSVDSKLTGKSRFWAGDAEFMKRDYAKAIQLYRQFLSVPGADFQLKGDAYYNIGYAYLNLQDTLQAIESFRLFTQQGYRDRHKLADGWMRIGDSYYSIRENDLAVKAYDQVLNIKAGYEDQALFYKGKTLGYMNKISDKIKAHEEILSRHPSSKYIQSSILEIAESYKGNGQYKSSLTYYTRFTTEYPLSLRVKEAELQIADIYFKQEDYKLAERMFKEVLTKYSEDRAVCAAGGKGLLAIYTALRTPEKISSIISSYPCADVNSDEEEDVFYATAYEVYADSNYRDAIPQLEKYLKKYPTGKYASELNLFMANSFFSLGEIEQSMEVYKAFLARPTNGYTEFAAVRVSKYLYNNGQYAEALPYYKQLEKVSSEPEVIYNARLGIMRSSFLEEIWKDAAAYASRLLRDVELDPKIKMEAHYANGMSNHRLQNNTEALISLEWITKNTSTVMSAEAKFTIAEIHYKSGNYEASEKAIRELMKMKPTYNYWVAKALILQSRTAIVMNDLFQAEQTLKSVRDHYPNKEDGIILEANQLWDELMQLKNKPKPVENSGAPIIDLNQKGN